VKTDLLLVQAIIIDHSRRGGGWDWERSVHRL